MKKGQSETPSRLTSSEAVISYVWYQVTLFDYRFFKNVGLSDFSNCFRLSFVLSRILSFRNVASIV